MNANADSEEFTSGVEGELNDTGESNESSSLSDSEEYVDTIISNTTTGKNIEKDSFGAFVTPLLEEDDTNDGLPQLASDDDSKNIADEMSESGDLIMEDVVSVADTAQEDCNAEQDVVERAVLDRLRVAGAATRRTVVRGVRDATSAVHTCSKNHKTRQRGVR